MEPTLKSWEKRRKNSRQIKKVLLRQRGNLIDKTDQSSADF